MTKPTILRANIINNKQTKVKLINYRDMTCPSAFPLIPTTGSRVCNRTMMISCVKALYWFQLGPAKPVKR